MATTGNGNGYKRGPFGEIYPPPLLGGYDPDEALDKLSRDSAAQGNPLDIPSRGKSREGMYRLAETYLHQRHMVDAIAGRMDDPEAKALRHALIDKREPMSLRPLYLETLYFKNFAPVLRLVAPDTWTWLIGVEGYGKKTTTIQAPPETAIEDARKVYVEWSDREEEAFDDWANGAITGVKPYYQHVIWLVDAVKGENKSAYISADRHYMMQRLGGHDLYQFMYPSEDMRFPLSLIFRASKPERAVQIADAFITLHKKSRPEYPPDVMLSALFTLNVEEPMLRDGIWHVGDAVQAKMAGEGKIKVQARVRYLLEYQERSGERMYRVTEVKRSKVLDSLIMPTGWDDEAMHKAALSWTAWVVGGKKLGRGR